MGRYKKRKLIEFAEEILKEVGSPLPASEIAFLIRRKYGKGYDECAVTVARFLSTSNRFFSIRRSDKTILWGLKEWFEGVEGYGEMSALQQTA